MKKYLAILLTIAMAACTTEPEETKKPDPVDQFILTARGEYTLKIDGDPVTVRLVDTVAEGKDYKLGDMIQTSGDSTVVYEYNKQYDDTSALYNKKTTYRAGEYGIVKYENNTLVFYGPYSTPEAGDTAQKEAVADPNKPLERDPAISDVVVVDPFDLSNDLYNMPNGRLFNVTHAGTDGALVIDERVMTNTPQDTLLYVYAKGLTETEAIFKTATGDNYVGIKKSTTTPVTIELYVKDGNPEASWTTIGTVLFTKGHLYKHAGGEDPTYGVPDNGLGYYANAKVISGILPPVTNKDPYEFPIVGAAATSLKRSGNWIKNNHTQRIPTAVTLFDGTLVTTGDLRWTDGSDAPHKTSSFVRISKNAEATEWEDIEILNNFNDFDLDTITEQGGTAVVQITLGVGLVDNSVGVGKNDVLIAMSMLNPPTVGLHRGSSDMFEDVHPFKNYNGVQYLLLRESGEVASDLLTYRTGRNMSTGPNNDTKPNDTSVFKYGVNVKGGVIVKFEFAGQNITKATPVVPKLYVDEYWELYTDAKFTKPYMTNQIALADNYRYEWSDKRAHAHLFFYASPYAPSYVNSFLAYSKSTDRGRTWSKPKDILHQVKKESHLAGILINSPAKGYMKRFGENKGRILFTAYKHNATTGVNSEKPLVFWTDNNGENWGSADDFVPQQGSLTGSESTIVEAPNGDLIIIARATGKPTYSISLDSGVTWSALRLIPEPANNPTYFDSKAYNQLSAANISHYKASDGRALIAFSHAKGQDSGSQWPRRKNGTLTIAALTLIGEVDSPSRDWTFDFLFNGGVGFQQGYQSSANAYHDYSGITELKNGDIGVFYEGEKWLVSQEGNALEYVTIPLKGL